MSSKCCWRTSSLFQPLNRRNSAINLGLRWSVREGDQIPPRLADSISHLPYVASSCPSCLYTECSWWNMIFMWTLLFANTALGDELVRCFDCLQAVRFRKTQSAPWSDTAGNMEPQEQKCRFPARGCGEGSALFSRVSVRHYPFWSYSALKKKEEAELCPTWEWGQDARGCRETDWQANTQHPLHSFLHFPSLNINLWREKHQNADILLQISVFWHAMVCLMNKASELCPSVLLFQKVFGL